MYIARRVPLARRRWQIRRLASQAPQPAEDQIFRDSNRVGTSLGTEDEWQAALKAQEAEADEREESISRPVQDDVSIFATNRIGQVVLPARLSQSVGSVLRDAHAQSMRHTVLRFHASMQLKNEGKKADVPMPSSQDFTEAEADAYIAGFMPQLYTSVYTVLIELRKRLGKDWSPKTLLDCGMGPGTSAFAFQEVFLDTNPHDSGERPTFTIIEPNDELRKRTSNLWKRHQAIQTKIYPSKGSINHQYDVILAPHALDDCKGRPSERLDLVRDLWARLAPEGILLLLERGNPAGFERIAAAREYLLRKYAAGGQETESAHIIAPCPGDGQCPMYVQGHDPARRSWCHFSQRLQRPDYLQRVRHSRENTEDVNYSYILLRKSTRPAPPNRIRALARPAAEETAVDGEFGDGEAMSAKDIVSSSYTWSRIILPPLKRHKHIVFDICSAPGSPPPSTKVIRQTKHSAKANTKAKMQAEAMAAKEEAAAAAAVATAQSQNEPDCTNTDGENESVTHLKWSKRPGPILQRGTVPRSQGAAEYRFARRAHWGDFLPFRPKTVVDRETVAPTGNRGKGKTRTSQSDIERAS